MQGFSGVISKRRIVYMSDAFEFSCKLFFATFLAENVVVQLNGPILAFITWSFIESQKRVYRKIQKYLSIFNF